MSEKERSTIRHAALAAVIVLAAVALLALFLFSIDDIARFLSGIVSTMSALVIGLCVAYLLSPILSFIENKLFGRIQKGKKLSRLRRILSLILTYALIIGMLYGFYLVIVPNVADNFHIFTDKYGSEDKALESIESFISDTPILKDHSDSIMSFIRKESKSIIDILYKSVMPIIEKYAVSFANAVWAILVGFIYSIYVLAHKEKLSAIVKKMMYAFFGKKTISGISTFIGLLDVNFGKYLRGKIIDSIIVGIVSAIVYMLFGIKFYPVLAIIAAVTNMIPFFGPFIGAVPAGLIVLIAQPEKLILLFLIILVLQQLDGNILDPMIVGGQVGLIPIFTMSSTILFGGIFGIPGMLLGVPIFASSYTLLGQLIRKRLSNKEKIKNPPELSNNTLSSEKAEN